MRRSPDIRPNALCPTPALPARRTAGRRVLRGAGIAALTLSAVVICFSVPTALAKQRKPCSERTGILGVSRVVEIDTTNGPRFGNQQYPDIEFLKEGEVVLTFDDGPLRRYTKIVLNALDAHCTKATFFMVGRMAVTDPDTVREVYKRGHTVGTHTWSHKYLGRQSIKSREREVELGISAVSKALGRPVAPFFRFPYLSDPKQAQFRLQARQQGIFSIDVDSQDFRTRSAGPVINRIMAGLKRRGKGILLFHDIQKSTSRAISGLLNKLAKNGYKVVHIVAKEPSKTLKKYDALAEKELARRKKAASSRPLVARSMVWPIATDIPESEPLTSTKKAPKPKETDPATELKPTTAAPDVPKSPKDDKPAGKSSKNQSSDKKSSAAASTKKTAAKKPVEDNLDAWPKNVLSFP